MKFSSRPSGRACSDRSAPSRCLAKIHFGSARPANSEPWPARHGALAARPGRLPELVPPWRRMAIRLAQDRHDMLIRELALAHASRRSIPRRQTWGRRSKRRRPFASLLVYCGPAGDSATRKEIMMFVRLAPMLFTQRQARVSVPNPIELRVRNRCRARLHWASRKCVRGMGATR